MTKPASSQHAGRGFTLVEMLAVVVLLGLIASVAIVSLVRADDAAAIQSARRGIANLDAQARLGAQTQGSAIVIHTLDDGARLVANSSSSSEGGWSASFNLPRKTAIQFFEGQGTENRSLEGLYIDRAGRSADVTIEIISGSGQAQRWFLCGLTGQLARLKPGKELR